MFTPVFFFRVLFKSEVDCYKYSKNLPAHEFKTILINVNNVAYSETVNKKIIYTQSKNVFTVFIRFSLQSCTFLHAFPSFSLWLLYSLTVCVVTNLIYPTHFYFKAMTRQQTLALPSSISRRSRSKPTLNWTSHIPVRKSIQNTMDIWKEENSCQ